MTDKQTQEQAPKGNMLKDPEQWTTSEDPMTGAQPSYLKTLSEEAGEPFDEHLTKVQAVFAGDPYESRRSARLVKVLVFLRGLSRPSVRLSSKLLLGA